jgi:hypothetical protein
MFAQAKRVLISARLQHVVGRAQIHAMNLDPLLTDRGAEATLVSRLIQRQAQSIVAQLAAETHDSDFHSHEGCIALR